MADYVDHLIKRYVSGQLDLEIKLAHKKNVEAIRDRLDELRAHKPVENIGGSKTRSRIAEQERWLMIVEEDKILNELKKNKVALQLEYERYLCVEWLKTVTPETLSIIWLKYKDGKTWWQIGDAVYKEERQVRRLYQDFKKSLAAWR